MTHQSNLNKIFLILFPLILSCNDPATITACSPNQQLDSCGNCYYTQNDPNWNDCVDDCGIPNGENICDQENISNGYCECSGCKQTGDLSYCNDCLFENSCECDNSLFSYYEININECSQNSCNDFYFDLTSLNLDIRERCGNLTSLNSDYAITHLNNIEIYDPCGEEININYFDDTNYTDDIFDGCDLPINSIYILDNGDVLYNSSDDIGNFNFSIPNHCENLVSNTCLTVPGCSWGTNDNCIQDDINYISNGDAERQGYSMSSQIINNEYYIMGNNNNSVIPYQSDYLNSIQIKNNDLDNSLFLDWKGCCTNNNSDCADNECNDINISECEDCGNIFTNNNFIEIPPNQIIIINHNNLCNGSQQIINVKNDSLTIHPISKIEGYYYSNNDYIKFDEININLIFNPLTEIYNSQIENCN